MKTFFSTFFENYKKVWSQFLPSSVISILFAVFGIMMVWTDTYNESWIIKIMLVLVISFFLFLAWSSWVQSNKRRFSIDVIGAIVLLAALIAYYLHLPADLDEFESIFIIRHILITIASVGLVFISHYQWKSNTEKFWNFSRATAEAIGQAIAFSIVLFLGLAATFASIDFLFGVDIPEEIYPSLWFAVVGGFATFYFLSKLPLLNAEPDTKFNENKLWKFFGVYILFPLLALYFLVLYAYTGKVLLTWEWPSGQISYMIAAFSLVGTLTYWILTPQIEGTEKAWKKYTPIFWGLLSIQVVVLAIAVGLRINQYGITPKRYLVVLFGIYLFVLCGYFIFSRIRDRRIIPVLFSGLILITSVGPWGVFGVSKMSQKSIVNNIFEQYEMVDEGGNLQKPNTEIPKEERKTLSSSLDFLVNTFGVEILETWNIEIETNENRYSVVQDTLKSLEVDYVGRWESIDRGEDEDHWQFRYLNLESQLEEVETISEKIFLFQKRYQEEALGEINGTKILFKNEGIIEISSELEGDKIISLVDWLNAIEEDRGERSKEEVTFKSDQIEIVFTNLSFKTKKGKVEVENASGVMMLK